MPSSSMASVALGSNQCVVAYATAQEQFGLRRGHVESARHGHPESWRMMRHSAVQNPSVLISSAHICTGVVLAGILHRRSDKRRRRRKLARCARGGNVAATSVSATGVMPPQIHALRKTEVCSYFRVDLFGPCKSMCQEEPGCSFECEVDPVMGFASIPEWLREQDEEEFTYELDGWWRFDPPGEMCEYYDLREHPEKFTGYDGSEVWRMVHKSIVHPAAAAGIQLSLNQALEAMQGSISAHIIRDIEMNSLEGLNAKEEFERRMASRPTLGESLKSTWLLLVAATQEVAEHSLDTSLYEEDADALDHAVQAIVAEFKKNHVDESYNFAASSTDADLAECRLRFRELCILVECVQCNHCRLHAKIFALGLATAFQVLAGGRGSRGQGPLFRVEVGALLNALLKVGDALEVLKSGVK
mmetsp:Transcript_51970/g.96160  ORF Transcript_51970/g.96160 Transcript_51970/m.96160 type:complete len:416 (+) Transcript_51970:75-1322(+)